VIKQDGTQTLGPKTVRIYTIWCQIASDISAPVSWVHSEVSRNRQDSWDSTKYTRQYIWFYCDSRPLRVIIYSPSLTFTTE